MQDTTRRKPALKHWCFLGIGVIFFIFVVAVFSSPSTPTDTSQDETANSEVGTVTDQVLADERATFNTAQGNNAEAAELSAGLIENAEKTGIGEMGVYTELTAPAKAETQFKNGGVLEDYQKSVTGAAMTVVVSPEMWSLWNDDSKKDFVSTFLTIMHGRYPSTKYPVIQVSNGVRVVATGSWSYTNNGPTVELK